MVLCVGMGQMPLSLMFLALCLVSLVGIAQASGVSLTHAERRRRLLGAQPSRQQVETGLSKQVAGTSVENVQDQDLPSLRGLKVAFYEDLDPSRTPAERAYIMEKLMPATATVLSRSMRVRQPSGKLPLNGYPDEGGVPIPGDAGGVLLPC